MNLKQLAQTGVMIPEIGMGTWKYTVGVEPLRKGVELGACFVDTAEYYKNEELVGQAIKGLRERVFVATKVLPEHFSRSDVVKSADKSLRLLGIDCIDLYQLHRPNSAVPIEETMGAMEQLVDAGKVRFIGVSNFSVRRLKRAQAAMRKHKIVSNQVAYSLANRTIEIGLLPYCEASGITVIAYSPLAHGLQNLAARDPEDVLKTVAEMTGKTLAQVALNWCVCHAPVIAIPKASTTERMAENCGASGWRLTSEQIQMLEGNPGFRRRGRIEATLRRLVGHFLRRMGWR
jgi:diketogulonate reductase-like aldo/keto reductase